jgi:hypothetical protein
MCRGLAATTTSGVAVDGGGIVEVGSSVIAVRPVDVGVVEMALLEVGS